MYTFESVLLVLCIGICIGFVCFLLIFLPLYQNSQEGVAMYKKFYEEVQASSTEHLALAHQMHKEWGESLDRMITAWKKSNREYEQLLGLPPNPDNKEQS